MNRRLPEFIVQHSSFIVSFSCLSCIPSPVYHLPPLKLLSIPRLPNSPITAFKSQLRPFAYFTVAVFQGADFKQCGAAQALAAAIVGGVVQKAQNQVGFLFGAAFAQVMQLG